MPVVAFVPLTILWTGTGDAQKFLIIFIGTFFQQVLLVMDNVKSVPREFINLGRTLEMPEPAHPAAHRPALGHAGDLGLDAHQPRLGLDLAGGRRARRRHLRARLPHHHRPALLPDRPDLRLPPDPRHPRPRHRPGDEGRSAAASSAISRCADDRAEARHRRPRQDLPHRPRRDGRARAASTSTSARTSSSRWSAPPAAASRRCSRSSPASRRMTRASSPIDGEPVDGPGPRPRRRLPELHAAALADRARQRRVRAQGRRHAPAARRARIARDAPRSGRPRRTSPTPIRASSPAA